MKKLFLSLSIVSSLFLVSCEDEFAINECNKQNIQEKTENTTEQGYWEVSCDQRYEVVQEERCDSIWTTDSSNIQVCDSVLVCFDSLQNPIYDLKCQYEGYWEVFCYSAPTKKLVEVCDSVWVEQVENTDSTEVDNGHGNNQGNGEEKCDTSITSNEIYITNDSVWVN